MGYLGSPRLTLREWDESEIGDCPDLRNYESRGRAWDADSTQSETMLEMRNTTGRIEKDCHARSDCQRLHPCVRVALCV